MVKPRVVETDEGITGEFDVRMYDEMQRRLRDKGYMETKEVIEAGVNYGLVLEVGPGPGYLGLEWLKSTEGTRLKGLEISDEMIAVAEKNARDYGLSVRVEYVKGDACTMPFEKAYFDGVFTNGSLHEWANPEEVLNEVNRVLKPGGAFVISDLKRDMSPFVRWFLWFMTRPKEIRPGLLSSIGAAYTPEELRVLVDRTALKGSRVTSNWIGVKVSGWKPAA